MRSKPVRGRPKFKATMTHRVAVEEMIACATPHDVIARSLGVSVPTMRATFVDEIANGGARKRREVISLLFRAARKGNAASLRKLEELTREALPPKPRPPGKKELAQREALDPPADWAVLLN